MKSRAQKAEDAWRTLCRYRTAKGIPEVLSVAEVEQEWTVRFDMAERQLQEIRTAVRVLLETLGTVPWKYYKPPLKK